MAATAKQEPEEIPTTAAGMWHAFIRECVPPGTPPLKVEALKASFYAGIGYMMQAFADIRPADSPTDANEIAIYSAMVAEVHAFFRPRPKRKRGAGG
jgi:hypothetical protein